MGTGFVREPDGWTAGSGACAVERCGNAGLVLVSCRNDSGRGAGVGCRPREMYLRVLAADRSAWDLVAVYLTGYGTGWLLWAGSLAISPTVRPAVWLTALALELFTPWLGRRWLRRHPVHSTHLPERLGQFTIILLGATLTNLRDAVPTAHPPARVLAAALAAFLLPASIWWIYTTYLNSRLAMPRLGSGQGYAYLHPPAGAAVLFLGWALAAMVYAIGQSRQMPLNARLVLGGSIVTWMLSGLGLHRFRSRSPVPAPVHRWPGGNHAGHRGDAGGHRTRPAARAHLGDSRRVRDRGQPADRQGH